MRILRPRRRLRAYATAFLLGAAVLLVGGWSALSVLVERRLLEDLRAAGIAVASLDVTAVGLHETRIRDVRLGADGDVTVAEIIATYDLDHFLRAQPQHLDLRDLRVSARLDAEGISLGSLDLAGANGGGMPLDGALRGMPTVAIESGRIALATPVGPLALLFKGITNPRSDGGAEAALDLQAQSAHGRFAGALKVTAAGGSLDADLVIADGSATLGRTLSTAFKGNARATWAGKGRAQVSAAFDLKGISLAATAFPTGSLAIEMAEARWTAQLALAQRDGSSDLQAEVTVAHPYENPRLSVSSRLTAAAGAWLWPFLGLPQPQQGSARIALQLEGPLPDGALLDRRIATPGDVISLVAEGAVEGTAEVAAANVVFPNLVTVDSVHNRLAIHASGGTLSLEQVSELRASGTLAAAYVQRLDLAPALSALLSGRLSAALSLLQPLHLVPGNGTIAAIGELRAGLASAAGPTFELRTKGQAAFSDDFTLAEFMVEDGQAVLGAMTLPSGGSARLEVAGVVAGKPDRFDGRVHALGAISGPSAADLDAASVDVNLDAAIAGSNDQIAIRMAADGAAIARQVSGAALAGTVKEVAIPILRGDEPLITIDLNEGAAPHVAYDLQLGAVKANLPLLVGGPKPLGVALALPGLRCAGRWTAAHGLEGTIQLADGSLAFPSLAVKANGLRAAIATGGGKWSADVGIAEIMHAAKPPLIAPLSVAGKAEIVGDRLTFAGVLGDRTQHLKTGIEIAHSFAADKGQATLKMPPAIFRPGGLQPRDLLPAISQQIEEVTGGVAIGGTIAWNGGRTRSDLKLLLKDVSFKSPQAEVVRLNSVVEIDSLLPFATAPGQQLAAGLVDVGLPLTDLVAAFRIEPDAKLVIEKARLSLAGGEVSMPTVAVGLANPQGALALTVKDVDLARLLQLAQIDGLAGTGSLSGHIPVSIAGDAVVIHDASLAAAGPGLLRYAPAATPSALVGGGANLDTALQALSNFQYTELTVTVNRESGGDTIALMHVKGRNPDFYGGYPVELNLNISGKLDQILDRSLAGYRMPENIRKSLGDFAQ